MLARKTSPNDDVIRGHLSGRDASEQPFVAGVYPLLLDVTCHFLAVDFDKTGWQSDAMAFVQGCRRLGLSAALDRSRSGRGGHAWLFFEHAVPAALARRLDSHLLTEAMENRPDIGLDSYDRLFPNQDTLPQGGFGNLMRPCLQRIRPTSLAPAHANDTATGHVAMVITAMRRSWRSRDPSCRPVSTTSASWPSWGPSRLRHWILLWAARDLTSLLAQRSSA